MNKLLLGAPIILILITMVPNAFAHHHSDSGSNAYAQGISDGKRMAQQGDAFPGYDDCINDGGNQATFGGQVSQYCSGLIVGFDDVPGPGNLGNSSN